MKNSALLVLVFSLFIGGSCSKDEGGTPASTAPTNLVVSAVVSTDGSGNVAFTATATNAVTYDFEFGNGVAKAVPSGIVNYQYTNVGTITYTVVVTAKSSAGTSIKKSTDVAVTVNATVPGVFWSDEFNTEGAPDPTKWGYDIGTGAGGWGNSELQYYTNRSENVIVQGGVLKIKAIKENYSGSAYTSTRLLSRGKFDFTYGTVEVKAKLPAGVGTWPAIWMLGSNIQTAGWPACGEIDIVEHRGNALNRIFGTLHYPGGSSGNAKLIANATTAFHLYKLEWTATAIRILVDDELIHAETNSANIPFNHNFFFLLNVAMGGSFAGAVDPAFTNATMEIDYIRVYK